LNGGILFSGNETTGVVGIKTRGTVFTGGGSLVKQFSPKLQLGVELTSALQSDFQLGKGQLQTLLGGNYQFRRTSLSISESLAGSMRSARALVCNLAYQLISDSLLNSCPANCGTRSGHSNKRERKLH